MLRPGPLGRLLVWTALPLLSAACVGSGDLTIAPPAQAKAPPAEPPPEPLSSGRLPDTAKPTRYELSLLIDPKKDRYFGDVTISVDVPRATQSIVLSGRNLSILRAEVASGADTVPAEASFRMAAGSKDTPEELVLRLARPISLGQAEIRIGYSAAFGEGLSAFYRVEDGGESYVFSQLEPSDARRAFPCFDEPSFKVPFKVKVTTPKGNIVVSNTKEASRSDTQDGRSTVFTFAETAPLPPYLVGLGVGPLDVLEGSKGPVPIRLVTTKGKTKDGALALETTRVMTAALADYFDRPYPYDKLDIVAIPEFAFGAMENAGFITFREERVLVDEKSATVDDKRLLAETIGHEVAHHWFGNLVTMAWWDDIWLNEGFATWMESYVTDLQRPDFGSRLRRLSYTNAVMQLDGLDAASPIRRPVLSTSDAEQAFDAIVYDKGSALIGMLENWLTPDVFRAGVRAYIKGHEHKNAQSKDLFAALSLASNRDVASVALTFLDQPGVPLVSAKLVCDPKEAPHIELSQTRHRSRTATEAERTDTLWRIPVCLRVEGEKAPVCTLLDARNGEVSVPSGKCPGWIYPNADEMGYYRTKLDPPVQKALLRNLRKLGVAERIGVVTNTWALVQSGDAEAATLIDTLRLLAADKDPLVVEEVIEVLTDLSDSLVTEATRPGFRRFVSDILLPRFKELGWDAKKGESTDKKALRARVLTALATLAESRSLAAEADKRAAKFLADPRSVDAETAETALLLSTRSAGETRLSELMRFIANAKSPDTRIVAVRALGAFSDPTLLKRALDKMLEEPIKAQDAFYLFDGATAWPASRPVVLAWAKERFPEIRARLPANVLSRVVDVLPLACDPALRDTYGPFFKEVLANVEGADGPLSLALEQTKTCIDFRAREAVNLAKKLP